jgi:hypothetical protein
MSENSTVISTRSPSGGGQSSLGSAMSTSRYGGCNGNLGSPPRTRRGTDRDPSFPLASLNWISTSAAGHVPASARADVISARADSALDSPRCRTATSTCGLVASAIAFLASLAAPTASWRAVAAFHAASAPIAAPMPATAEPITMTQSAIASTAGSA